MSELGLRERKRTGGLVQPWPPLRTRCVSSRTLPPPVRTCPGFALHFILRYTSIAFSRQTWPRLLAVVSIDRTSSGSGSPAECLRRPTRSSALQHGSPLRCAPNRRKPISTGPAYSQPRTSFPAGAVRCDEIYHPGEFPPSRGHSGVAAGARSHDVAAPSFYARRVVHPVYRSEPG